MEAHIGKLVFPGQILCVLPDEGDSEKLVLGPGLINEDSSIICTKPGIVRRKDPLFFWIDSIQKRYVPAKGDSIVGTIMTKSGDNFKVDVGGSEPANLSYLAFEGATKRNRPDVKVGDIVYAKFSAASKYGEPELVCIDSYGRSNGYGVIRDGGYVFTCTLNLARKILRADCPLLPSLGLHLPYEISVGVNGRIWVKGRSSAETIAIMNAVQCCEFMDSAQIKTMVRQLGRAAAGEAEGT